MVAQVLEALGLEFEAGQLAFRRTVDVEPQALVVVGEVDAETLELKLDEAVMRESSKLERLLWLVKTVSVVAPLMGLLGTVTGMIQTFQRITLYGAGDPKMMASGLSEALVTTMLGLIAAIPLLLLHSVLSSLAKGVSSVLEEQTTGLIAVQSESEGAGRPGVETA